MGNVASCGKTPTFARAVWPLPPSRCWREVTGTGIAPHRMKGGDEIGDDVVLVSFSLFLVLLVTVDYGTGMWCSLHIDNSLPRWAWMLIHSFIHS